MTRKEFEEAIKFNERIEQLKKVLKEFEEDDSCRLSIITGGNCCNNSNYDPELIMDSYITDLVKDKLKIYTKRFVQELNEEIERLSNVINDLLDYE